MKSLKYLLLAVAIGSCGQAMAGGGIVSLVKKVGTLIDSMSVRGVDRRYIDAPEKPWQLILKSNVSQTILRMKSDGLAAGKDMSKWLM